MLLSRRGRNCFFSQCLDPGSCKMGICGYEPGGKGSICYCRLRKETACKLYPLNASQKNQFSADVSSGVCSVGDLNCKVISRILLSRQRDRLRIECLMRECTKTHSIARLSVSHVQCSVCVCTYLYTYVEGCCFIYYILPLPFG